MPWVPLARYSDGVTPIVKQPPRWRRWGAPLLEQLVPILVYGAAAVGLTWPTLGRLSTHVAADLGDSLQNTWNIWWIHRALGEGRWFFDCPIQFYPHGTDLYFHTLSPATTVPGALLVFLGLAPAAAYNVMVLVGLIAGGWAHYFLARRLEVGFWPALVAGAALSFGPFHIAHSAGGHLQLTGIHWLSLYVAALIALFDAPTWRRGVLAALALALVTFTDWYILITAGLVSLALLFRWSVKEERFLRKRETWLGLAAAAGTYAVTAGPLLAKMIHIKVTEALSAGHSSWYWAGDIQALVLPNRHMLWARYSEAWRDWTGNGAEASTYLGLVLLLAGVWAIWNRSRGAITLVGLGLVFAVLTLGPYLHWDGDVSFDVPLPYLFLERYVPILGLMGCPGRFALGAAFCLTLAGALGLNELWEAWGWRRALSVVLGLGILVELAPAPFPSSELPTSPALAAIAREQSDFAVMDTHFGNVRLYHQTLHGRPIVIGHTSRYRRDLWHEITHDPVLEQIRNPPGLRQERLTRIDERIFFDWGRGAPAPVVPRDHFEVRWRGELLVPFDGWWRFFVDEDDGCRLRIDGERVIDSWWRHSRRRVPGELHLSQGWHDLEMDYFDWSGPAVVQLRWSRDFGEPEPVPGTALRVAEDQPGIEGTYVARVEALPEGGREAVLARLHELNVRYIIKPAWARSSFERLLGLESRREGRMVIFEVPGPGDGG